MKRKNYIMILACLLLAWGCRGDDPVNEVDPEPTPAPTPEPEPIPTGLDLVYVKGGTFMMGVTSEYDSQRLVTLSDFYIGKYEVTQGDWESVMGSNPSRFQKGDDYPVEQVSWEDAQTFIRKLRLSTGKNYRLATEAEWEFAARGGTQSNGYLYSGSNSLDSVAWFADNGGASTHPVGQKSPNELGIYDMSGNVDEWCNDLYVAYSYVEQTDPMGAWPSDFDSEDRYIYRGGSYSGDNVACHVSSRHHKLPSRSASNLGFRIAFSEPKPLPEIEMVYVEGGTFTMGSPASEPGRSDNEVQHQVTVSSFHIGKYEVTLGEWKAVTGSKFSSYPYPYPEGEDYPVGWVSWNDVQTFILRLNNLTGMNYRLPTEAEWEFAARGGNQSKGYMFSGSDNLDEVAWYDNNAGDSPHYVGQKLPNELGIYDMSGNVYEWCSDWFGDYSTSAQVDPTGPSTGYNRVIRGGDWGSAVQYNRVACHFYFFGGLNSSSSQIGFRLVR
ncbi:MAG: formylglycine-generating enzyme family protein [Mediterranea sp.]|jgi:formylglycine-generating enzyme required for sulfatase activity|nr:formylglycine-generating enzyme family protein [Mediterranea sp.]